MQHHVLHDSSAWRLERWGKGLSYLITNKRADACAFFQGDDADEFERDLGVKEEDLSGDVLCDALWDNQNCDLIAQTPDAR
jgi:hypothetical protein